MMATSPNQISVFLSYAPTDEAWVRELEKHLGLIRRQGLISTWYNQEIIPGTNRAEVINQHLEQASIILLFVSANFLASDACYDVEMTRALERHEAGAARVIPLIIRPTDWTMAPFAKLSPLPTDAKAITTWSNQDEAFVDVVAGIRKAIEDQGAMTSHIAHSPIWNVPYQRNPYFTGRDDLLDQLEQQLAPTTQNDPISARSAALTQPQAIKGLGGIGKTQIAVEYAYRSRDFNRYTHTLWVNAESEEAIIASFVIMAGVLPAFAAKHDTDQRKLIAAVKHWFEHSEHRWLLIFDNADDLPMVRKYLPREGKGDILLTTRAYAVGSLALSIEVDTMGMSEGIQLLLRRAQREEHASDEERNQAGNIVIALDHFPLALDQAGAYLEETQCSFVEYLDLYQDRRKDLNARRGLQTTDYPDSVATTWSLSLHKVEQASPAAADFLRLCAFLAPDLIPEELIREGATHWNSLLQEAVADRFSFNQMIEELLKYSLVKRLTENRALSIHRLVQAVQQDLMEPEVQRQWAQRVVQAVNKVFPGNTQDIAAWPQCRRYLNQAQACHLLIERYQLQLIEAANLLNRTGLYLNVHALHTIAEPLYQRALAIQEQQLGPTHPEIATTLTNLANNNRDQNRYEQAEPLYQRALAIQEQQLGPAHPRTVTTLDNLAMLYWDQDRYEQAEPFFLRAGAIQEQQLGSAHLHTAINFNNLANLYWDQGRYEQAKSFFQRALAIHKQQLGSTHLHAAVILTNLANLYQVQGTYEQAEPLYQRALAIQEQQSGPAYPETATTLTNLANLYQDQGRYEQAEPLYQRALAISEQQLGPAHLHTATVLTSQANLYQVQGRYEQAEPLYQHAGSIWEQQLGPAHPETATILTNLAMLYQIQGKYEQAEPQFQRALAIREQIFGTEHPDTTLSVWWLAVLSEQQQYYQKVMPLYERALANFERTLGSEHPHTQGTKRGYTALLHALQQREEQIG